VAGFAGLAISKIAENSVKSNAEQAVTNALTRGDVSVMPFLRTIAEEKGKNNPLAQPMLDAFQNLEGKGWRFGDSRHPFESALSQPSYAYDLRLTSPAGRPGELPADALPTLQYLLGSGTLADLDDKNLADKMMDYVNNGRAISKNYNTPEPVPTTASLEEKALQAAGLFSAMKHGQRLTSVQNGLTFRLEARNLAELEAAVKTMDDTANAFDGIFGAALGDGKLDMDRRQDVMEAAVSSPLGAEMDKPGRLLLALNDCWVSKNETASERTRRTLEVFHRLGKGDQGSIDFEQAIGLVTKLSPRLSVDDTLKAIAHLRIAQPHLDPAEADRYQKDFLRLLSACGDTETAMAATHIGHTVSAATGEAHIALLEGLAAAGAAQEGYRDVMLDYATLVASRAADEPLEKTSERYCTLLRGLAEKNQAEEAAPTFAMLSALNGRGSLAGGLDAAVADIVARVSAGESAAAARHALVPASGNSPADAPVPEIPRAELEKWLSHDEARDAANHLTQRLPQLEADERERYVRTFARLAAAAQDVPATIRGTDLLQALPADAAEEQLKILEQLAQATPDEKPEERNLLMNYATLMAARDPAVPLADSVNSYSLLLRGLHDMGQSREAAPTFLFLREGQASGRFAGKSFDDLCDQFLMSMFTARDAQRARQSLVSQVNSGTANGGVTRTDDEVRIGGVAIPIRNKEKAA